MNAPNRQPRIIDTKMPVTWLLTSAGTVLFFLAGTLWQVAGQSNKLDTLITAQSKIEKRLDEGTDRYEKLKDAQYEQRRINDTLVLRVTALESRVITLESLKK